jgi:flavin-dependent dehydrogenase
MKLSSQPSVAESLSTVAESVENDFTLQDGSRVAVVGGGPSGSFFSFFLLKMAAAIDLDIEVDIYEPRFFKRCGPGGCNHCGGVVSESLVQILAAEGINLPRTVVQRGIESYQVHMDVGDVTIQSPAGEQRIAALYRGNGPREGEDAPLESFDGYLQGIARERGARVVRELITGVDYEDSCPNLHFANGHERKYDLVAVAAGVNSNFINLLDDLDEDFEPPRTTRGYICEFRLGEKEMLETLGKSVHVFLLSIPRFEFAAIIPKGEFATVVMVGDNLDQELVHAFLQDPVVQRVFPTSTAPCVCSCSPLINLGARKRPYGNRVVMVGDSGITRLYKDGIGAAYKTAKAAASTAILQGVSREAFAKHFWPACKAIVNDNNIGKIMFATNTVFKHSRVTRSAMLRMAQREQARESAKPHMSSLLWNMFTGSEPYLEMFRGTFHPGFIGHLALNLGGGMWPFNNSKKKEV